MDFRTVIPIQQELDITHHDKVMMFGSCFSSYMGEQMSQHLFPTLCNPLGILFNPLSILQTIERIANNKEVTANDLFESSEGVWNSYLFHSQFAQRSAEEYLTQINCTLHQTHLFLKECKYLFITLGTAWYYEKADDGQVVANCHKQPAQNFLRKRLSVEACTNALREILKVVRNQQKEVQVLFTVSPIRHWKEGAHGNQLSKSTLLLAIDEVISTEKEVYYFPSYELLLDELRDYRFYAEDMLHPSENAQRYIWERFSDFAFSNETQQVIKDVAEIRTALNHRPFNPESKAHQQFILKTQKKWEALKEKHPEFATFAF